MRRSAASRDDHLVGLNCPTEEEISREEYDEMIARTAPREFLERKWWTLRDEARTEPRGTVRVPFVSSP